MAGSLDALLHIVDDFRTVNGTASRLLALLSMRTSSTATALFSFRLSLFAPPSLVYGTKPKRSGGGQRFSGQLGCEKRGFMRRSGFVLGKRLPSNVRNSDQLD